MKLFILLLLAGLVWLAWVWSKKPGLKHTTARTWPANRGKTGLKPKLASRL